MLFLCGCACLSLSDLLAYGYDFMMLNVLIYDITIKIQQKSHKQPALVDSTTKEEYVVVVGDQEYTLRFTGETSKFHSSSGRKYF